MIKRLVTFMILIYSIPLNGQHFEDVALDQAVYVQHESGTFNVLITTGACWFDCDSDGDLDLFVANTVGNHLFRNNRIGQGTSDFTDIAAGDLLNIENGGSAVAAADYDNDGDNDLYLANYLEDILLENDGEGSFTNVTSTAFPQITSLVPGYGTTVSWGDLNNDGWLDLYVGNYTFDQNILDYSNDYLFISDGGETVTFTDRSDLLGGDNDNDGIEDLRGFSWATIMTDFNNDGLLDIYTTNDCPHDPEDNKLWKNEGDLNFKEVSQEVGPFTRGKTTRGGKLPDCINAMGITRGDVNNDGYIDYHMSNVHDLGENSVLLINREGSFVNASYSAGLDDEVFKPERGFLFTWGTLFFDYDLDGYLDLATAGGTFVAPEDIPNFLYHNELKSVGEIPYFEEVDRNVSGFSNNSISRTIVMGDFDMDNDPDLFLTNLNGVSALYQNNNENGNQSLVVTLKGTGAPLSNFNGIGSKVYLTTPDEMKQFYEVHSGSGLGGGDDMAAYFGMSEYTEGYLEVIWPSGIRQEINGVTSNQRITIEEPSLGVLWPKGNEFVHIGTTEIIRWKSIFDDPVSIVLMNEMGEETVLADSVQNSGEFDWVIAESVEKAADYKIIIKSILDQSLIGKSNHSFSISSFETDYNKLTWPNGGELINQGDTVLITWEENVTESVSINLLLGEKEYLSIDNTVQNDGVYEWIVPDSIQGNNFKIMILSDGDLADKSDNSFVITSYTSPELPSKEEPDPEPEVTDVDEENVESSGIQNFPNPFSEATNIVYSLTEYGNIELIVYDFTGKSVVSVREENKSIGRHEIQLNGSRLPVGLYFVKINLDGVPVGGVKILKKNR